MSLFALARASAGAVFGGDPICVAGILGANIRGSAVEGFEGDWVVGMDRSSFASTSHSLDPREDDP